MSLWLEQLERLKSEAEKRSRDAEVCRRQLEKCKNPSRKGAISKRSSWTADLHGIDRETEALRNKLREAESREAGQASRIAVLRANLENCRANLERVHRENEERAKQAEKLAEQFSAQETRIAELSRAAQRRESALRRRRTGWRSTGKRKVRRPPRWSGRSRPAPRRRTNSIRLRSSAPPRRPALPGWTDSRMICIAHSKTQVTA